MPEQSQTPVYEKGYTCRTLCGQGRSTYDPDWSPSKPWSVVFRGEVRNYKMSLDNAKEALQRLGCRI